jgi:hypothetical protein
MPETCLERLEEIQKGLRLTMMAVKKLDSKEAERLLLILGGLMDRALEAERAKQ